MYFELFTKRYVETAPFRGRNLPRTLPYLRRVYHFNLDAIIKYYLSRTFAVKNTFILSRMLEHFSTRTSQDAGSFLEYVRSRAPYVVRDFGVTSEINRGSMHPGAFFGFGNEEIVINIDDSFSPYRPDFDWKTASAVKTFRHNINDINLLLPNGKKTGSRTGICSIGVHMPLLLFQYRAFMKQQMLNLSGESEEQQVLNKSHFIYRHVLAPALGDIIDHTFLNMVMDRFYGRERVTPKFKHPFRVMFPEKQIEDYIDDVLVTLKGKNGEFPDMLRSIPMMYRDSALDLLVLPDLAPTVQVRWATYVSRLDHMCFLIDVAKSRNYPISNNVKHIDSWRIYTKRIMNDRSFRDFFSSSHSEDIKEKMNQILNA